MKLLVLFFFLLVGLGLIVFGMLLLWKRPLGEIDTLKLKLPFTSLKFSGVGAAGIFCIAIGVGCLLIARDIVVNGGQETQGRAALALVTAAAAQLGTLQTLEDQNQGWVYAPEGSFIGNDIGNDIKKAQRPAPLRADHFDDLTGTFVGKLLGYDEPDVVDQIESGDCVKVNGQTVVGFGKIWMKVEKTECPADADN